MDATHFVMCGLPARLWGKVRLCVKTSSVRKRYNVLGALNFVNEKIETIENDSYITSTQAVQLLEKSALTYVGNPITIILDNDKYQRCTFVTTKVVELGIDLIFGGVSKSMIELNCIKIDIIDNHIKIKGFEMIEQFFR